MDATPLAGDGLGLGRLQALEKLLRVQQRAPQRGVVPGPRRIQLGIALELGAHGFHLRVQIVQIMQHERLGEHGELGRAELVLAVVADDEVLDQDLERRGEAGNLLQLGVQQFELDDEVAQQLALGGVAERAGIAQLANLSDVMQEGAGEQQVPVDERIVAGHQVAGAEQRYHVVEQSADACVVHRLGRGRVAIVAGNLRIGHEQLQQTAQVGLPNGGDELAERLPEFIDILRCFGKVIGEVDLGGVHLADLVNRELPALVVLVDQSLDLDDVVLLEVIGALLDVVPHLGLDGSGAVHQGEVQIRLAALFRLDLFVADDVAGGDHLVFLLCRISNIKLFHQFPIPAQAAGNGFYGIAESHQRKEAYAPAAGSAALPAVRPAA